MKRLITPAALLRAFCDPFVVFAMIVFLSFVTALVVSQPAHAASYTVTTTTAQEAAITDARTRYNNSIPATVCDASTPPVCTANPALKATNGAFMLMVITNAVTSWDAVAVRPALSVSEKASAITMLNADVARGDANSATAAALLAKLNAAQ